jgi:hypothetical protein
VPLIGVLGSGPRGPDWGPSRLRQGVCYGALGTFCIFFVGMFRARPNLSPCKPARTTEAQRFDDMDGRTDAGEEVKVRPRELAENKKKISRNAFRTLGRLRPGHNMYIT